MKYPGETVFLAVALWSCLALVVQASPDQTNVSGQDAVKIEEYKAAIAAAGLDWTAGHTSVSDLSMDQTAKLCGTNLSPNTKEKMEKPEFQSKTAELQEYAATSNVSLTPPASLDWRRYSGNDWTTPIKDQASCGSCWAFATFGAYEALAKLAVDNPNFQFDMSEQDMVSCAAGCPGCYGCRGADMECPLRWSHDKGAKYEACFKYTATDPWDFPATPCCWQTDIPEACKRGESHYIRAWNPIDSGSTLDMQKALMRGPIVATMRVYDDFFFYTSGIYEHTSTHVAGGHAVVLVGWGTDATSGKDYWIGKNSWGTGWGENGWFKIRRGADESRIEDQTYALDLRRDTIGFYRPSAGKAYFDYNNDAKTDQILTDSPAGAATDIPVSGSWETNGVNQYVEDGWGDGWGLFRPSTGQWFLDTSFGGAAEITVVYGGPGDRPISGDWNGDGRDGIGVYEPSTGTWRLDDNIDGKTDRTIKFGISEDKPITGDWTGDGKDKIGVFRPSTHTFYLDTNMDGRAELIIKYGLCTDKPIAGDWNFDGQDDIGQFRKGIWYFDYNFDGITDKMINGWGISGDVPVPGNWFDNPRYSP
jgi:C1A family cysteine protease